MTLFTPPTFSTDWEVMVVDRLERCVETKRLTGFSGQLAAELALPITVDINSLEFPLGINYSFAQLQQRIWQTTERTAQLLAEYELDLYPAGAHPLEPMTNSSHIHVGTLTDEVAGIYLENQLFPYVPAFAALAANSPAAHGQRGEYKSYRVRYQASGDIVPSTWRDPRAVQRVWGDDVGPKLHLYPTLELRVTDCTSSRRLLAELATFAAAFIHRQGKQVDARPLDPVRYRDYLINRWCAARDGMQATFRWQGGTRPVAELLDEMLDECAEELRTLGATRADFPLLNLMVEKRICQADLVHTLMERYPDPYLLASAYGKMLRHWEWFDDYLPHAHPLDPQPALCEEEILAEHVKLIGEGTGFYAVREAMSFPPAAADAMLARMVEAGLVTTERLPERGLVLSRTPGAKGGGR